VCALWVSTGQNNIISQNFVTRMTLPYSPISRLGTIGFGADCAGNIISHNNIDHVSGGAAIIFDGIGGSWHHEDNVILGNNITTCEVGIDLFYITYTNIIMDNTIRDCHQMSQPNSYGWGIVLGSYQGQPPLGANENLIIRNNITECTRRGIQIIEGHGNAI